MGPNGTLDGVSAARENYRVPWSDAHQRGKRPWGTGVGGMVGCHWIIQVDKSARCVATMPGGGHMYPTYLLTNMEGWKFDWKNAPSALDSSHRRRGEGAKKTRLHFYRHCDQKEGQELQSSQPSPIDDVLCHLGNNFDSTDGRERRGWRGDGMVQASGVRGLG